MKGLLFRSCAIFALSSGVALTAPAARAESAGEPAPVGTIEEVIVTAQKRVERLQDVPLAVTAVSGETLQRLQINDTNTLIQVAPSLTYQQGQNPTNTSFRIRGIGTSLFGQGLESSVSVVLDGVVMARGSQSFTDLADIERIEVLRGPQGTLFGKNATAGVINVVTARPSQSFAGKATLTLAEGGERRVSGTVTGPLGDKLAGRLTAYYNDVRGYVRNRGAGGWENGYESWGARGKLLWRPTENLEILGTAEYRQNLANCCQPVSIVATTPALVKLLAPVVASPDNREVSNNGLAFTNQVQATYSVEGDLDLGWSTVTSITAYQHYKQDANNEVDNIFNPSPVFVGSTGGSNYSKFDVNHGLVHLEQFSQELRLASPSDQRLTYVLGTYYFWLELDRPFERRRAYCTAGANQIGSPCTPVQWQSLGAYSLLQSTHVAGFGQAEYRLVDKLKLIGGLRVQRERVSVEGFRYGPLFPGDTLFSGTPSVNAGQNAADTAVTGKLGLKYEFSRRAQAYATYTRGYKGLGFSTEIQADFAAQAPILPEHVNAYEIGFKGQTADRRASVAVALFLQDYTNLQIQANRSDTTTGVIQFVQTNAGSARTKGVEVEGQWNPTDSLSVTGAVTYAKATINIDGQNCPIQFQAAAPIIPFGGVTPIGACYRPTTHNAAGQNVVGPPIQDIRDGALPASPRWRISLAPQYRFALGAAHSGSVQVNVAYQAKQNFALEQDPLQTQKAYTLVDASLEAHTNDGRYRLTFFVKNLFDQTFYQSIDHNALLASVNNTNDLVARISKNSDRYVGATLDVSF
ncbi:MAG: TonB-dependent receptor [Caulobacterales bacterium]|nr:TonB-dependent receptor [Caulobacterales bacterium]